MTDSKHAELLRVFHLVRNAYDKTAAERDRLKAENAELVEALEAQSVAVTELFKELGKKEVGDWGIINDGLMGATKAIAKAKTPVICADDITDDLRDTAIELAIDKEEQENG